MLPIQVNLGNFMSFEEGFRVGRPLPNMPTKPSDALRNCTVSTPASVTGTAAKDLFIAQLQMFQQDNFLLTVTVSRYGAIVVGRGCLQCYHHQGEFLLLALIISVLNASCRDVSSTS